MICYWYDISQSCTINEINFKGFCGYGITALPLDANKFEFTSYIVLNIPSLTIIMPKILFSPTKMAKRPKIFIKAAFNLLLESPHWLESMIIYIMFTYTGFQWLAVLHTFGNLEKPLLVNG